MVATIKIQKANRSFGMPFKQSPYPMNYNSSKVNIPEQIMNTRNIANRRFVLSQSSTPDASIIIVIRPKTKENSNVTYLNLLVA